MKPAKVSPLFVLPVLAGLLMLASCRHGNPGCDCPASRFESGAYFSQIYEDYVLDYVFKNQKMGYYVDVGANDPDHDSVTKIFYERGWRGVNIEPNADEFKKIIRARPRDGNYNVGISDTEATLPFYQAAGWRGRPIHIRQGECGNTQQETRNDLQGDPHSGHDP